MNKIGPIIGISPTMYRAQNPETPKSQKKSPERSLGPDPGPPKSSEKIRKVKSTIFWTFRTFSELVFGVWGPGWGGSKTPFGRPFLRLFGVSGVLGFVDGGRDPKNNHPKPGVQNVLLAQGVQIPRSKGPRSGNFNAGSALRGVLSL